MGGDRDFVPLVLGVEEKRDGEGVENFVGDEGAEGDLELGG